MMSVFVILSYWMLSNISGIISLQLVYWKSATCYLELIISVGIYPPPPDNLHFFPLFN